MLYSSICIWPLYSLLARCHYFLLPTGWQDLQPIDRFVVEEYLLDVLLFLNGWFVDVIGSLPLWLLLICPHFCCVFCMHSRYCSLQVNTFFWLCMNHNGRLIRVFLGVLSSAESRFYLAMVFMFPIHEISFSLIFFLLCYIFHPHI